jgi:hypothetical protein
MTLPSERPHYEIEIKRDPQRAIKRLPRSLFLLSKLPRAAMHIVIFSY